MTEEDVFNLTKIDPWFVSNNSIVEMEKKASEAKEFTHEFMTEVKQSGLSDRQLQMRLHGRRYSRMKEINSSQIGHEAWILRRRIQCRHRTCTHRTKRKMKAEFPIEKKLFSVVVLTELVKELNSTIASMRFGPWRKKG